MSKKVPQTAVIDWFEHVRQGDVPEVFKRTTRGRATPCPGDGIFAEVTVDNITFAMTALAKSGGGVTPAQFEIALRSFLAALANSVDAPQEKGVYVYPKGEAN